MSLQANASILLPLEYDRFLSNLLHYHSTIIPPEKLYNNIDSVDTTAQMQMSAVSYSVFIMH
jgi:hypothetical protein